MIQHMGFQEGWRREDVDVTSWGQEPGLGAAKANSREVLGLLVGVGDKGKVS